MSQTFELEPPLKSFFGTTTKRSVGLNRSDIPVHVLGLTPANVDNTNPNRPCINHHIFRGDENCFLFDFPQPFDFGDSSLYPFFVWDVENGVGIALSDTDIGETFPFGYWADYPNRAGMKINWSGILEKFGAGKYYFYIGTADESPVQFTDGSNFQFTDGTNLEFTDL